MDGGKTVREERKELEQEVLDRHIPADCIRVAFLVGEVDRMLGAVWKGEGRTIGDDNDLKQC